MVSIKMKIGKRKYELTRISIEMSWSNEINCFYLSVKKEFGRENAAAATLRISIEMCLLNKQ